MGVPVTLYVKREDVPFTVEPADCQPEEPYTFNWLLVVSKYKSPLSNALPSGSCVGAELLGPKYVLAKLFMLV